MTSHRLRCWPPHYEAMAAGQMPFDIRKNDRGYQKGDVVIEEAYDNHARKYCDQDLCPPLYFRVLRVISGPMYGLREDYVCMGLRRITEAEAQEDP